MGKGEKITLTLKTDRKQKVRGGRVERATGVLDIDGGGGEICSKGCGTPPLVGVQNHRGQPVLGSCKRAAWGMDQRRSEKVRRQKKIGVASRGLIGN